MHDVKTVVVRIEVSMYTYGFGGKEPAMSLGICPCQSGDCGVRRVDCQDVQQVTA
jgi:hypothetical protein